MTGSPMFEVKEFKIRNREWYRGETHRSFTKKPRVYVWLADETVLENFGARFNRPSTAYRKVAIQALEDHGIAVEKLAWSQRAGCSCGCSPGFVLTTDYSPEGVNPWNPQAFDVHIEVTGPPTEIDEAGAVRLAQLVGVDEALEVQRQSEQALIREFEEVGV